MFALPRGKWEKNDEDSNESFNFAKAIGDPSGFYFPLSKQLAILRANKQLRQESLPLAFRKTVFHMYDIDDAVQVLIAAGRLGRANIESLELAWQSRADAEMKHDEDDNTEDPFLTWPTLHVSRCVSLLKQCERLENLRLYFAAELVADLPDGNCNYSIGKLSSVRGIKNVEIYDLNHVPLEQRGVVSWLREQMQSTNPVNGDGQKVDEQL